MPESRRRRTAAAHADLAPDSVRAPRAVLAAIAVLVLLAAATRSSGQSSFVPGNILGLGNGSPGHALLVEKDTEKVFLFESRDDQPPRLLRAWNATTGVNTGDKEVSGDHRTPEGIYFFTRVLEDRDLPAMYGARALVMDYPNVFDRRQGKTGSGIWLHATDELVRPLTSRRTRGCVVVTNRDILEISKYVTLAATPIVVEERIVRLDAAAWEAARGELLAVLESWRRAWSEGDAAARAAIYAPGYRPAGEGRKGTPAARRPGGQGEVEIAIVSPTLLRRGGEAIARFGELVSSRRGNDYGEKTLWLELGDGRWRVVSEVWRPLAPPAALLASLGRPEPAGAVPSGDGAGAAVSIPPSEPAAPAAEPTPPVATVASLVPAPPVPAPGGGLRDAPDPFSLLEFLADAGHDDVSISFRFERSTPSARAARGHLTVVVRFETPRGRRSFAWPPASRLRDGEPVEPARGDSYSVRRFKLVDARLPGLPGGAKLAGVSVFIHDAAGNLVQREDYGG